jgi:ADP-ribose pyrophosphatase YjhB (NUDIX family)
MSPEMLHRLPRPLRRLALSVPHLWFRLARPLTVGVRALVLDEQGRVLLVRHSYLPGWHLPGGGVEAGESAEEALERELWEEGNIKVASRPRLLGVYFNTYASRRDHVLLYEVSSFRQAGPRVADWEIREARFFGFDELPEDLAGASRRRIGEWRLGTPPELQW